METTEEPDNFEKKDHAKIQRVLEIDQILSLFLSVAGMSMNIAERLTQIDPNPPTLVKYSVVQFYSYMRVLSMILNDEFTKREVDLNFAHLPIDSGWKDLKSTEERFIFVVKNYYQELCKEGKIS